MLAERLKADVLDPQLIDEVAHRLQLPKEEVEAEDEQPGSLLHRLLIALGSASAEPLIPPEAHVEPAQRRSRLRHRAGRCSRSRST